MLIFRKKIFTDESYFIRNETLKQGIFRYFSVNGLRGLKFFTVNTGRKFSVYFFFTDS